MPRNSLSDIRLIRESNFLSEVIVTLSSATSLYGGLFCVAVVDTISLGKNEASRYYPSVRPQVYT